MTETWRFLPYHIGVSSLHFALSDALVRHVETPTVWWHSTDQPTLILGPTQSPEDTCQGEESEVRLVKRHAGGTAVRATKDVLGLDVALPADHVLSSPDVVEAYRWIGMVWTHATQFLGANSHLVSVEEARWARDRKRAHADIVNRACFGSISPYEVSVGWRKLVGLAQVRRRKGTLLQCGIHMVFDSESVARLLCGVLQTELTRALDEAAIGLDEATGRQHDKQAVMNSFQRSLEGLMGVRLEPGHWTDTEWTHALSLESQLRA